MASTDALALPLKNTAYRIYFPIFLNTQALATGWTGAAATKSLDGATAVATTNTPTEIATTSGMGWLDLTAAEMNTNNTIISVTVTNTGALPTIMSLYPATDTMIRVNVVDWLSQAVAAVTVNGVPIVDLKYILGTVLTETAGQIAAGVKKFFNVASPTSTMNEITLVDTTTALTNAPLDSSGVTTLLSRIASALTISGGAVNANIVSTLGTALAAVAGYVGLDWSHINAPTTTVDLTGTKINTLDNAAPDSTAVTEIGADVDELIASVTLIPTNPLLTTDIRLSALDATISSRSTYAGGAVASVAGDVGGKVLGGGASVLSGVGVQADVEQWRTAVPNTLSGGNVPTGIIVQTGTAQAGGASTVTLANAASATDSLYNGDTVSIVSGTGAGQDRSILAYVGATRVATVSTAWTVQPDNTSVYEVLSVLGSSSGTFPTVQQIVNGTWDEPNASHVVVGSTGLNLSNAGGSASPATIAAAVWAALLNLNNAAGSFGAAINSILTKLTAGPVTNLSPSNATGTVQEFIRGQAYDGSENLPISWVSPYPALNYVGATATFYGATASTVFTKPGTISTVGGVTTVSFNLAGADTAQFVPGLFSAWVTLANGHPICIAQGAQVIVITEGH